MAKSHLRVSQKWRRHFDAPAALMRLSSFSKDAVVVDEDAWLHVIDSAGTLLVSKPLEWMPVAAAVDEEGHSLAVLSPSGNLLVMDRNGNEICKSTLGWKPKSLDMSSNGEALAFIDGSGRAAVLDLATRAVHTCEAEGPFHYVRFLTASNDLFASGIYGQVLFLSNRDKSFWQKDFRCHTRVPALSASGELILVPSPHYGIIALDRHGRQKGLFEVPHGPKSVAVCADGKRIFVINENNELVIFDADGKTFFRQPLGRGVSQIECDCEGRLLTAVMSTGEVIGLSVGTVGREDSSYIEFTSPVVEEPSEGPALLWRTKVFSELGGARGGTLAVTRGGRHVALLDIEAKLRIFDQSGVQKTDEVRIRGRTPTVKASRSQDLIVTASSNMLIATDLRSYRQRRLALKNEWTTHFDVSPSDVFFAAADFFCGISIFDESLDRREYLETPLPVSGIAVDGCHRVLALLEDGSMALYSEEGAPMRTMPGRSQEAKSVASLARGFIAIYENVVDAYESDGDLVWSVDVPGEVLSVTPLPFGVVLSTVDGNSYVTNPHGTIVSKLVGRDISRFFAASRDSREIISIEYRERLLTARSSERGVLWRREMDDDILAMETSCEGAFVAVVAGAFLYGFSTAAGEKTPEERLYLEI